MGLVTVALGVGFVGPVCAEERSLAPVSSPETNPLATAVSFGVPSTFAAARRCRRRSALHARQT
jgi:hypothetical protein